jgi:hypothetical protein
LESTHETLDLISHICCNSNNNLVPYSDFSRSRAFQNSLIKVASRDTFLGHPGPSFQMQKSQLELGQNLFSSAPPSHAILGHTKTALVCCNVQSCPDGTFLCVHTFSAMYVQVMVQRPPPSSSQFFSGSNAECSFTRHNMLGIIYFHGNIRGIFIQFLLLSTGFKGSTQSCLLSFWKCHTNCYHYLELSILAEISHLTFNEMIMIVLDVSSNIARVWEHFLAQFSSTFVFSRMYWLDMCIRLSDVLNILSQMPHFCSYLCLQMGFPKKDFWTYGTTEFFFNLCWNLTCITSCWGTCWPKFSVQKNRNWF